MAASGDYAVCCHQAFRLPARDYGFYVPRGQEAVAPWYQPDAPPLNPVGCQCPPQGVCLRGRIQGSVCHPQGRTFLGQPAQAGSGMAQTAANHRLHDHHAVLQPHFQGRGTTSEDGKKKGGIKVHANIHANEGVPSDIRFTSAATNDSFMLRPSNYASGDIVALDRAYIDYAKFEELTQREVVYVTKMKKNLNYETVSDTMYMHPEGLMEYRVQHVIFRKHVKDGDDIEHHARIITYADIKKGKARLVSLLTNDMDMEVEDIVAIYRKRWEIELLFKQLKQNFPLRYFYGESANAIKIQIWVTLIANLLLMVMQRRIRRSWSFSNLATMFRIMLMYYVNCYTFFEQPEKDWLKILETDNPPPGEQSLFD